MSDWMTSLGNWVKLAMLVVAVGGGVYICCTAEAPLPVDVRVKRAKAELARVTVKYGRKGKLPVTAWLRPEVALPPALAEHKQASLAKEGKNVRGILVLAGYAGGSWVGALLPFSRKMESEADTLGIRLMAQAGFDPEKALAVHEQIFGTVQAPAWVRFLSTHPADAKRLTRMRKECAKLKSAKVLKNE